MTNTSHLRQLRPLRGATLALIGLAWVATNDHSRVIAAPDERPAKVLPADLDLVPRSATAFVSVRLADLWNAPYVKQAQELGRKEWRNIPEELEADLGSAPSQVERLTLILPGERLNEEPVLLVTTLKPYDPGKVLAVVAGGKEEKLKGRAVHVSANGRMALVPISKRSYLVGLAADVRKFLARQDGKKEGPLGPALTLAAGKHLAVIGINGPRLAELMDRSREKLPPVLRPLLPLLKARPLAISGDIGEDLRLGASLTFANEEDARAGEKALREGRTLARQFAAEAAKTASAQEKQLIFGPVESGLKEARIDRKGATLRARSVIRINPAILGGTLLGGIAGAQGATTRNASMNNLKLLGLAFHNYHDQHKRFPPPAIYGKDGKPLLSWRVGILPYLGDEEDKLYKQFKLDEPWDSEHNKKLLVKIPAVYAPTRRKMAGPGETFYQGFIGKSAFFEKKEGHTVGDIPDGLSKTIAVVEAAKAVPWTKPEDIPFDPSKPVPQLGGLFKEGFHALFADGHVTFFSRGVKLEDLKPNITRNARDRIRLSDY